MKYRYPKALIEVSVLILLIATAALSGSAQSKHP